MNTTLSVKQTTYLDTRQRSASGNCPSGEYSNSGCGKQAAFYSTNQHSRSTPRPPPKAQSMKLGDDVPAQRLRDRSCALGCLGGSFHPYRGGLHRSAPRGVNKARPRTT